MPKERVLAYTDAVIAIIITIMVLEFNKDIPHTSDWHALFEMLNMFWGYVLSFLVLSTYWNNHHHLFQVIERVTGSTLWLNNMILFWLSLIPFATAWMTENHFESNTVFLYGIVLVFSALSYFALSRNLVALHGADSTIAKAMQRDIKGKLSLVFYIAGTVIAIWSSLAGIIIFSLVNLAWFIPDRRVEKMRRKEHCETTNQTHS